MNIFDIIGPVMIGPSSSHTAGAVRLGLAARKLLGEPPVEAVVRLRGSFAKTYKGHGTDKAVAGGLLGMGMDDSRIKDSLFIAEETGLKLSVLPENTQTVHPNSLVIEATGASGKKIRVEGASVGGGNILLNNIDGIRVDINCRSYTLIIRHLDEKGVIAAVTSRMAEHGINIAGMEVFRSAKHGNAVMVIETDQPTNSDTVNTIRELKNVLGVSQIDPI